VLRSRGHYGVRMLEKRSWTATWRPSTTTAHIAGMVGVIATRHWSDCGRSWTAVKGWNAHHDGIVRSSNVLDKELSSGGRYATLQTWRCPGDAPPAEGPRGDVQHEPLPLLVLSFASTTLLLSFLTSTAATFSVDLLRTLISDSTP
jgi:hypothetical protein